MGAFCYNVEPRYTPGSSACVERATAERVAKEEQVSIGHALRGAWGPAEKTRAEAQGLGLIVFSMKEVARGWEVEDLITGKRAFWPFYVTCGACGRRKVRCRRGRLEDHVWPEPRRWRVACHASGVSAARDIEPRTEALR